MPTSTTARGCYRSSRNWGEKYLDTLRTTRNVTFVNRACSGGVLPQLDAERKMDDTFIPVDVPGIVDKDDPRARPALGAECTTRYLGDERYEVTAVSANATDGTTTVIFKCTRYMEPQWDAVGKDTDLVMFSIGGNDVEFGAIVKQCFAAGFRDPGTCREKVSAGQARMPAVGDQLTAFLRRLKSKMRADARVVIKPYPYLEKDKDLSLTSWFGLGSDTYAVGKEVRALGDAGDRAQRTAIETVNAEGGTPISFLERVKPHFATHEPDGRACCDNNDRWLNEFGSTTMMEWYHYG